MRIGDDVRTARVLLVILVVLGLQVGCTGQSSEPAAAPKIAPTTQARSQQAPSPTTPASPAHSATPTTSSVPASTPTPTGPKAIRIGMSQEPDTITGYPGGMYASAVVQNLIFNVLVGVDDKMGLYPDLVEYVPTLENGGARWIGEGANRRLQTTFRLRRDVRWSDGKPFTSRDVRFTWELTMNPESGAFTDLERKYETVETPDDHTVVFTMMSESSARAAFARDRDTYADLKDQKGPVIDPLYMFGIAGSWIYPEHVLRPLVDGEPRTSRKITELFTSSSFARSPVGTGPYTLVDWAQGTSMSFKARSDYFRGAPRIENVVFTFVPSARTLVEQLRDGEIDVITQDALDVTSAPQLDSLTGIRAHYVPSVAWEHLDLNLDHPILRDRNVRKALLYGIDRSEIADKVFHGKCAPARSMFLESSWAFADDVPDYGYDPDRARELLLAAGWRDGPDGVRVKDGQRLTLRYVSTDWPLRERVSALLKEQLKRIGVDLTVEHVPSKSLLAPRTGRMALRDFEISEYAWIGGFDPGLDALYFYASSSIPSRANNFQGGNYPGYRNADVDALLATGLATLDHAERTRVYQQLQRLVMEDLPALPLCFVPNVSATSGRLVNFRPGIAAIGETWNIHEWDLR